MNYKIILSSPSQIQNNFEGCDGNNDCNKQPNHTGHWKISSDFQASSLELVLHIEGSQLSISNTRVMFETACY
jgi:hypothetical protein